MSKSTFVFAPFFYFDSNGLCNLPTPDEVIASAKRGIVTALILDANVCLNLTNYAIGQKDLAKEILARTFLLSIEFCKLDVVPFFACMELACRRNTPNLDHEKLSSFAKNIKLALGQSEYSLAQGEKISDKHTTSEIFSDTSIEHILPMLRYAYAAYLKIHEIRSRGHLKGRAIKNLAEFSDWCEFFECHIPIIFQAAFALFGGCKEAQTILTIKKNTTPLDAAWGAAWDTWYVWIVQNYLPTQLVDGVSQRSIFVTDDAAAAFIAGKCTPKASFLNHGQPLLSASELSLDFPYYLDRMELLKSILKRNLYDQMSRITSNLGAEKNWDDDKICKEIMRLEQAVTFSSRSDSPST